MTLPLQVEVLYNEYRTTAAFAAASLLTLVAVATLAVQFVVGRRSRSAG
jgi:sulfate transport system permease protein